MARIKPQALLVQSKRKKGPTRISATSIIMCNLIVALVVLCLVTTYRHWSHRSTEQVETGLSTFEDTDTFVDSKKYDLPGHARSLTAFSRILHTVFPDFQNLSDRLLPLVPSNNCLPKVLNTSKGSITVELFKDSSPETVDKFIDLCQKGYFKGMPFHHVIKNYVLQAGRSEGLTAAEEWTTKGKLHGRLVIRPKHEAFMVGTSKLKDTKGFELFITTAPIPDLNDNHIVFGRVIKGEDVVQEIEEVDTDSHYQPKSPVLIFDVTLKHDI